MAKTIETGAPQVYELLSVETNLLLKQALIRYAPAGAGMASPHVKTACVRNEKLPPMPERPKRPADEELKDEATASAYNRALADFQLRQHERIAAEAAQHFDVWLADTRPDVQKAEEFFDKHHQP